MSICLVLFKIQDMLPTTVNGIIAVAVLVKIKLSKLYIRQRRWHITNYTASQSMLDMVLFLEKLLSMLLMLMIRLRESWTLLFLRKDVGGSQSLVDN